MRFWDSTIPVLRYSCVVTYDQFEFTLAGKYLHKFFAFDISKGDSISIDIKMQLFETASANFWFLGMEWDKSSQKFLISFKKLFVSQFNCVVCFVTMLLFLIEDAESFDE